MNEEAKKIQTDIIRAIRHKMVDLDLTGNALCKISGISPSHWLEMKNNKKPIRIEKLIAACMAVGLRLDFKLIKNEDAPISNYTTTEL